MRRTKCMPWFKMPTGQRHDDRVKHLCRLLHNPLADVYVSRLWGLCGEFQPDGRFPTPGAVTRIEANVDFAGDDGALVGAMVEAGLLVKGEGFLEVAEWRDLNEAQVKKFERDAEKPRGNKSPTQEAVPSLTGPSDVPRGTREGLSPLSSLSVVSSDGGAGEGAPPPPPPKPTGALAEVGGFRAEVERIFAETHHGERYAWSIADETALRGLMARAGGKGLPEVLRRLSNGMRAVYGGHVDTLAQLDRHEKWNANAAPERSSRAGPVRDAGGTRNVRRGSVPAEAIDHTREEEAF